MKWKRLHNILKHRGYKKSYCSSIAVQENKKVIQNIDISTIVWLLLYGAPGGIRTPDLPVRSRTLYPTKLLVHNQYYNVFFMILQDFFKIFINIIVKNQIL